MANEIQVAVGTSGITVYAIIRNATGLAWRVDSLIFETYTSANYTSYAVTMTEQGTGTGYYAGTFPTQIVSGVYSITAKNRLSGGAVQTDPNVGSGDMQWNGSYSVPLSDLATSGQVSTFSPIRIARGIMIQNFTFNLVGSADHITSFVSGIVSGQISRDGAAFTALQSGVFNEIGLGFFSTNLTSGDLLCNTAGLLFTGIGISGGTCDPRRFSFITQKTSGQ